jgi:hypothetical protein
MTLQLRKAERSKVKLKIGMGGISGSGKTYSALLMASGISSSWDKIAVIDTENMSADLYAHLGSYNVITITPPFTPEKYIEAIKLCEDSGMEVVIIDSCTHVWNGEGGLLEYQAELGGRYQDWKKTTPRYQRWLNAILQSKCHMICTTRRKTTYSMETENGKSKVTKKGLDDEIRGGFEYEMSLTFGLDINNFAESEKNRTTIFKDGVAFKITSDTGRALMEWANTGVEAKEIVFEPTETRDPVNPVTLKRLEERADLKTINEVCGLSLKKIENITQTEATACLVKLMSLKSNKA